MALPIRLTWNLQMPRSKKVAILLLFASGFVCILFACLRVAQVAINAAKPEADGQPLDPTWIAIWGMVECSIGSFRSCLWTHSNANALPAVIIGCCPAFAILINAFRTKTTYDSRGYRKQTESNSAKGGGSNVQLRMIGGISTRERNRNLGLQTTDSHWADAHSSQEGLRAEHNGIMVSTTVTQNDGTASVHAR